MSKTIVVLFLVILACSQVVQSQTTNEALLFGSQNCEDCEAVKQWWREHPEITDGSSLKFMDSKQLETFELLLKLEEKLGIKGGSALPALYYKNTLLYGANIVPNLPKLLQGTGRSPTMNDGRSTLSRNKTSEVETNATIETHKETICLGYFFIPGCRHCSRTEIALKHLQTLLPNILVDSYDVTTPKDLARLEIVLERLNLKGDAKSHVPLVVWSGGWISGTELSPSVFAEMLKNSKDLDPLFWRQIDDDQIRKSTRKISRTFRNISILTIISAGLLDGINPCAFATIIFLISYLALAGRTRGQMAVTGISFGLGVFVCYFLIGLGLLHAISFVQRFHWISTCLYAIMTVIVFSLFIGTIRDIIIFKKAGVYKMKMGLSQNMIRRIHSVIRSRINSTGIVAAAIAMGFLVSVLSLTCTGQIYFPTLILMNSSQMSGRSLFALFVFNVAFIVPLLVVTVMAILGVTSQNMAKFSEKNVVWTKSLMAIFFLAIAVFMAIMLTRSV